MGGKKSVLYEVSREAELSTRYPYILSIFTFLVRLCPAQHKTYEGERESRAWRKMQTAKLTQGRFAARE